MPATARFPCPCCGYRVFLRQPGSSEKCPICQWEDDLAQLRFPRLPGSANHVSLEDAQHNFADFGSAERRHRGEGRTPLDIDARESGWRALDPACDNLEEPLRGIDYGDTYPLADTTVLYIGAKPTGGGWRADRIGRPGLWPGRGVTEVDFQSPPSFESFPVFSFKGRPDSSYSNHARNSA